MYSRKAIIISSQSPNGKQLLGISKDAANFPQFLMSPNGGAIDYNNIIVLNNPTCRQVKTTCLQTEADFLQVYVSTHGCTTRSGQRMLCFMDGELEDLELLNNSDRQVVIADTCRTRPRGGAAIGSIDWAVEKWKYATGYSSARAWFDQYIAMCPKGKWIFHSASDDQYSRDTATGGAFTVSLLESIYHLQQTGRHEYLTMPYVLQKALEKLSRDGYDQVPEQVFGGDASLVPFAIISPEFIPKIVRRPHVEPAESFNTNGLLALGGIALSLYIISKL